MWFAFCCRPLVADGGKKPYNSHLVTNKVLENLSGKRECLKNKGKRGKENFMEDKKMTDVMGLSPVKKSKDHPTLNENQAAFVREYVRNGGNATAAAITAGYSKERARHTGWDLTHLPKISDAIKKEQMRHIGGELANVALGTLSSIMRDEAAPAAARVQASRWVLEAAGHGLPAAALAARLGMTDADKPLSEFSLADLEEMTRRASESLERMRSVNAPTIEADDAQVIDT
jgi:hypothetical protein